MAATPLPPEVSYLIVQVRRMRKLQKLLKNGRAICHESDLKICESTVDSYLESVREKEQPTLFEHLENTGNSSSANLPPNEDSPCEGGYD